MTWIAKLFPIKGNKVTDIFERFNAKRDRIFDCGSRNFTVYSMEAVRC